MGLFRVPAAKLGICRPPVPNWAHIQEVSPNPVTLSPEAAEQVASFIDRAGGGVLRLGVRGGGCSGFQYVLTLDTPNEEDLLFESEGQTVAVNPESLPYLAGSHVVWREELMGGGFDVENPNARSSCGCGNSFRIDEQGSCEPAL